MERHLLEPFLPKNARLMMLGSFPPKPEKWSMNFYYPNPQNDMWRIFGLVFFDDKSFFERVEGRGFDETKIKNFLRDKGIAVGDMARFVNRARGTASDKDLEILETLNIAKTLLKIPHCAALAATGQKACGALAKAANCPIPQMGEFAEAEILSRKLKIFRMPSSSRAYPMRLEEKARFYESMFSRLGLL